MHSKKISISHVNQAFNVYVKLEFTFSVILGTTYTVLHTMEAAKLYSEAGIVSSRSHQIVTKALETQRLNRHVSATSIMQWMKWIQHEKIRTKLLDDHGIEFQQLTVRRHNKIGIVEL